MVPSLDSLTKKRLKTTLDVTTNVVVILFAVVAIGVLVKNYFAPQGVRSSVAVEKGSLLPEIAGVDYKQTPGLSPGDLSITQCIKKLSMRRLVTTNM